MEESLGLHHLESGDRAPGVDEDGGSASFTMYTIGLAFALLLTAAFICRLPDGPAMGPWSGGGPFGSRHRADGRSPWSFSCTSVRGRIMPTTSSRLPLVS